MGTFFVGSVVIFIVGFAAYKVYKDGKTNKSCCGCCGSSTCCFRGRTGRPE